MDRHEWTFTDHLGGERRGRVVRDPSTLSQAEASSETTFTAEMFAGAEILRLAEESAARAQMADAAVRDAAAARQDERARIRRELEDAPEILCQEATWEGFLAALDRICPE